MSKESVNVKGNIIPTINFDSNSLKNDEPNQITN